MNESIQRKKKGQTKEIRGKKRRESFIALMGGQTLLTWAFFERAGEKKKER